MSSEYGDSLLSVLEMLKKSAELPACAPNSWITDGTVTYQVLTVR